MSVKHSVYLGDFYLFLCVPSERPGSSVFQAEVTIVFRPKSFSIPDRSIQLKNSIEIFFQKVVGSPWIHPNVND